MTGKMQRVLGSGVELRGVKKKKGLRKRHRFIGSWDVEGCSRLGESWLNIVFQVENIDVQ